jgi:arylsulfatase A-like enzyme/Tfp pilus assembly protein PilF
LSRLIYRLALPVGAELLLLFGLCTTPACARHTSTTAVSREHGLNVLLITVDTLRADAVGAYGQPGGVTPWIDRLATGGARFTNAHAQNVLTLPSHANILSGRLPGDHGVRDNAGFRFPATMDTIATLLKSHGYNTGAFISAFPLESRFGLSRSFDFYDDRFADAARPAFLIQERTGRETTTRAVRWLETQWEKPWFCWVHIYEPHFPYSPVEPFASRFPGDPYHGEVAAADASLAPLLESIVQAGKNSRTLVVLTSDHGESLGDHGEATHGVFAYEATLKVPLVIYQPRLFSPAVVDAPAQHVDLLPTILDALALPAPAGLPGRSLLPTIAGNDQPSANHATYFEALSATLNRRWAPLDGVIQDRVKYIDLPIPELYDLSTDPREERNLASAEPARVEALRTLLGRFRRDNPTAPQRQTAETRERLRSLGYLAASGNSLTARYTEADDPKRLIALDAVMQDVTSLYLGGNLQAAATRCRELIGRRPEMPLSYLYLAHIERERGQLDSGVEALRRAVDLAPDNAEAVALLGAYLTQAGKAAEASVTLERYERNHEPDVEVLTSHGLALAKLGRTQDALAILEQARQLDSSNAMLLVHDATIRLMGSDRDGARRQFEAALRMNPDLARAHSSLGILDVEDRRLVDAATHWKAATSADPREFETILGIGLSLQREGRTAEARAALEFFVANAPPERFSKQIDRARQLLTTFQ